MTCDNDASPQGGGHETGTLSKVTTSTGLNPGAPSRAGPGFELGARRDTFRGLRIGPPPDGESATGAAPGPTLWSLLPAFSTWEPCCVPCCGPLKWERAVARWR